MSTKTETLMDFHVTFGREGTARTVKRENSTESVQQLGVYNDSAGDSTDDVKFRQGKSITISSRVTRSSISPINVF
eukprot:12237363-Ditylum_brightwellii.AAC.1